MILAAAALLIAGGCSHGGKAASAETLSRTANLLFTRGDVAASLRTYEQLLDLGPDDADRVLFEMGIIYAHPRNDARDYAKAMACFRRIVLTYPESDYRRDSQMMMLQIDNVIIKDKLIAEQQAQMDAYRREIKSREYDVMALREENEVLAQKVFDLRREPVDQVLIEKQKRRLSLISKGEVIKSYRIALGADQTGPKVRQGDNKTPEGSYTIESRNHNSKFHLSLRISYPNEQDRRRARALGVSPGGDIMIHGLKNGQSWVGQLHSAVDWTEGCIAVTNLEIEEIARLVPDGTPVEIRP